MVEAKSRIRIPELEMFQNKVIPKISIHEFTFSNNEVPNPFSWILIFLQQRDHEFIFPNCHFLPYKISGIFYSHIHLPKYKSPKSILIISWIYITELAIFKKKSASWKF